MMYCFCRKVFVRSFFCQISRIQIYIENARVFTQIRRRTIVTCTGLFNSTLSEYFNLIYCTKYISSNSELNPRLEFFTHIRGRIIVPDIARIHWRPEHVFAHLVEVSDRYFCFYFSCFCFSLFSNFIIQFFRQNEGRTHFWSGGI